MRNLVPLAIAIFSAALITIGCGKNLRKAEVVSKAEVKSFENEFFTMHIADGYNEMSIKGGVQAYRGNSFIEVHYRGENLMQEEAKAGIYLLAKNYEGSVPDIVDTLGIKFFHSSIILQGASRDVFMAVRNGRMISITISRNGQTNDGNLEAMFGSIKLKA